MAKFAIPLMLIWVLCSFGASQTIEYTCDPDTDCIDKKTGDKVPDANDCEKYYMCITSTDGSIVASTIPLSCPIGTHFNQGGCVPGTGPCENKCRAQGVCSTTCAAATDFAADIKDCSKYSVCSLSINTTCQDPIPYFNGVKCVDNPVQCCDFCTPYCLAIGLEIQDPCDCTSFYVCRNKGKPSDDTRGTCPVETYYDETINSCVAGSCTSLCPGAGCGKTQSTTTSVASSSTTSPAFN